jgi:dienelactone hydrolase
VLWDFVLRLIQYDGGESSYLSAAVPYYGGQPTQEAEQITTPLLLHYAGLDSRVNEGWPAYEAILRKNNIENTAFIYPGVNHGFHNNTTPRMMKLQLQYHGVEQSIF